VFALERTRPRGTTPLIRTPFKEACGREIPRNACGCRHTRSLSLTLAATPAEAFHLTTRPHLLLLVPHLQRPGPAHPYAACVMRFSAAGVDAVSMMVQAIAPTVEAGGALWVYGNADEGCTTTSVTALLEEHYFEGTAELQARSTSNPSGGGAPIRSVLVTAQFGTGWSDEKNRSALKEFAVYKPIMILQTPIKGWCTYPGLFAGGGLDVMTAAMLSTPGFSSPPKSGRVLDFASGSGCIAAALRIADPGLCVFLFPSFLPSLDDGWVLSRTRPPCSFGVFEGAVRTRHLHMRREGSMQHAVG
jgi:hypothetical protein